MVTPQALAAAGVNRVRVELALANPPKTVDYTSPGFSGTEALFAQALEEYAASIQTFKSAGFGILLLLDYQMANDYQGYDEDDARWAIYRAVFKDRATRAAQRLLGMIDAYEIWNEPDALGHIPCGGGCGSYPTCVGGPCPTAYGRYIDLLEDGIDAVRTVDPGAFVLSGVATPDYYAAVKASASPTTTGLAALQKLDAFNLHPYNTWPGACVGPSYRCDTETRQGNANYLVTELQKLEDTVFDPTDLPRRPVWFTEWGRQTSKVAGCDWQDASDLIGAFFDAMSAPNADTGLVEQAYFFQWVESSSAASLVDTKGAHATPPYQQNYDAFRKGATTLGY
jgi:hypothetical protein